MDTLAQLRDKRDLARTRMALVDQRTKLKNRIHATLAKYGLCVEVSDLFGKKGRELLDQAVRKLPPETEFHRTDSGRIGCPGKQIQALEGRMKEVFEETEEAQLSRTLPGVGFILSVVLAGEMGEVGGFQARSNLLLTVERCQGWPLAVENTVRGNENGI